MIRTRIFIILLMGTLYVPITAQAYDFAAIGKNPDDPNWYYINLLRVSLKGEISYIASNIDPPITYAEDMLADWDGNYAILEGLSWASVYKIAGTGIVTKLLTTNALSSLSHIALDRNGNLLIADYGMQGEYYGDRGGGIFAIDSNNHLFAIKNNIQATGIAIDSIGNYVISAVAEHYVHDYITAQKYRWWDNAIIKVNRNGKILQIKQFPEAVYLHSIAINKDGNYVVIDSKASSSLDSRKPQYNYSSIYIISPAWEVINEWHREGVYISTIKVLPDNSYYGSLWREGNDLLELFRIVPRAMEPEKVADYYRGWHSCIAATGPIYFIPEGGEFNIGDTINLTLQLDPCYRSYDLYLAAVPPQGAIMSITGNGGIVNGILPYARKLPTMTPLSREVLSITIPGNVPRGTYTIYACLIPTGMKADLLYAEYVRRCNLTIH